MAQAANLNNLFPVTGGNTTTANPVTNNQFSNSFVQTPQSTPQTQTPPANTTPNNPYALQPMPGSVGNYMSQDYLQSQYASMPYSGAGYNPRLTVGSTDYSSGSPDHWPEELKQRFPQEYAARWRAVYGTPVGQKPADASQYPAYPGSQEWYKQQQAAPYTGQSGDQLREQAANNYLPQYQVNQPNTQPGTGGFQAPGGNNIQTLPFQIGEGGGNQQNDFMSMLSQLMTPQIQQLYGSNPLLAALGLQQPSTPSSQQNNPLSALLGGNQGGGQNMQSIAQLINALTSMRQQPSSGILSPLFWGNQGGGQNQNPFGNGFGTNPLSNFFPVFP